MQLAGTAALTTNYNEAGMSFTPINPTDWNSAFGRVGADPRAERPDNGTSYLQAGLGSTLAFNFANGSIFDLLSVDLAEYSTVVPDAVTVQFIGYHPDGSSVTTSFTTDGIIDGTGPLADFQTFNFTGFTDLARVAIPTYGWSLDNLVVSVPEPTSGAMLLAGGLVLGAWESCRRRR